MRETAERVRYLSNYKKHMKNKRYTKNEQVFSEHTEVDGFLQLENPEQFMENVQPFFALMMEYECALMEVETKLQVLYKEFSLKHSKNPFESIESRIKRPRSIVEKLKRKGCPLTMESIEENLFDVAGIRVVCSFPEDIYTIAELLVNQDDVRLVEKKDYIKQPKESGYRSLHLLLEIPVFLSTGKKYRKVEVQLRTIAMDFWASLEHKLHYKKHIENTEEISKELEVCASMISQMDFRMQEIRNKIEKNEKYEW